jgi:hypothetical protein
MASHKPTLAITALSWSGFIVWSRFFFDILLRTSSAVFTALAILSGRIYTQFQVAQEPIIRNVFPLPFFETPEFTSQSRWNTTVAVSPMTSSISARMRLSHLLQNPRKNMHPH